MCVYICVRVCARVCVCPTVAPRSTKAQAIGCYRVFFYQPSLTFSGKFSTDLGIIILYNRTIHKENGFFTL